MYVCAQYMLVCVHVCSHVSVYTTLHGEMISVQIQCTCTLYNDMYMFMLQHVSLCCSSTRTPVHVMMWCLIFVLTGPQLVRLASGPTPAEGRVELYYNGSPYDQKG